MGSGAVGITFGYKFPDKGNTFSLSANLLMLLTLRALRRGELELCRKHPNEALFKGYVGMLKHEREKNNGCCWTGQ